MVLAAARFPAPDSAEALSRLCESYWVPVYAFVRRKGHPPADAADLTQEFFARVLDKRYLTQAQPDRGRFRSFLLAAVTHFLSNEGDRRRAVKRGGRVFLVSIDADSEERRPSYEPRDNLTPEQIFERRWAIAIIESTLARLQAESAAGGRDRLFERLRPYLTGEGSGVRYADVARDIGVSEAAVKVKVHRLRRRFNLILRDEVAQTVARPEDIESELQYLLKVVST